MKMQGRFKRIFTGFLNPMKTNNNFPPTLIQQGKRKDTNYHDVKTVTIFLVLLNKIKKKN
jgi:hypothetical protein